VIARSVLPTDSIAITELLREMRGAVHVTFEEGIQAQWLHDRLAPLADRRRLRSARGAGQMDRLDRPRWKRDLARHARRR
jgi:hypothetical protein